MKFDSNTAEISMTVGKLSWKMVLVQCIVLHVKGGPSDFHVFRSFLAAISSFLGQSGQTKYLWNLWDEFYLAMKKFLKLHYDVIEKLDFQKKYFFQKKKFLTSHNFFKF